MGKSRILILHSFNDKSYQARLQQIANNPSLDGIVFQHCCVIDPARSSDRIRQLDWLADHGQGNTEQFTDLLGEVVKVEVGPLLDQQITEFSPEVVIIHCGTIFKDVPGACITMIMELMDKHPGLPFVLQGKHEWLIRQSGRPHNAFERRWVISQMRSVKQHFVEDKEVQENIDAIF
jgi:hypothetical protein